MSRRKKVSILGFGFSGLSAAWAFERMGFEVEVHEKSNRIGGLLGTHKTEHGLVETAANAILKSHIVDKMASDFGINWAIRKKTVKNKWVFTDRPRRWPLSLGQTLINLRPILSLARSNPKLQPRIGETVTEWGTRHFKGSQFVDHLLGPALQGIYGQGPATLSASLSLKSLFANPRVKTEGSYSPKNGMSEFFVKGLETLSKKENFKFRMSSLKEPQDLDTDIIVDTRPDYGQVLYLPITSVTLFFKEEHRPSFYGFGCLFSKPSLILGVLFNSDIFEGRASTGLISETWIVAGVGMSDASLHQEILNHREIKFGVIAQPVFSMVSRWEQGIPSYGLRHESFLHDKFQLVQDTPQGTLLKLSNYTGDIGLNKILEKSVFLASKFQVF